MKVVFLPLVLLLIGATTAQRAAPASQPSVSGSCRQYGTGGADLLLWIKRTVTDSSVFAERNRTMSGLALGDSSAVAMVTDSTTCAALALQFARGVAGRDTTNASNVYAVAVGTAYWVVTDYRPLEPPLVEAMPNGAVRLNTGPQVMPTLTINQGTGAVKSWNFEYLRPAGARY